MLKPTCISGTATDKWMNNFWLYFRKCPNSVAALNMLSFWQLIRMSKSTCPKFLLEKCQSPPWMTWLGRTSSLSERPIYVPYVQGPFLNSYRHLHHPQQKEAKIHRCICSLWGPEKRWIRHWRLLANSRILGYRTEQGMVSGHCNLWGKIQKKIITTDKDTNTSSTCNQIVTTFFQSLCAFSDNPEKSKDQPSHRTTT